MCVATASQNRSDRRGRRRRGDRELIRLFPQHYSVCVRFRCFVSLQRALHQLLDLQLLTGESTVCCSCAIEPKRGLIQILQASNSLEAGYGRSCWRVENSKSSLEDLYPKLPWELDSEGFGSLEGRRRGWEASPWTSSWRKEEQRVNLWSVQICGGFPALMIRYYYISSRSGSTDGSIDHHHHHRRRFLNQWLLLQLLLRHHGTILEHTPSSITQPNLLQGRGGVRELETV